MNRNLLLATLFVTLGTPLIAQAPPPVPVPPPAMSSPRAIPFVQHAPNADRVVLRSEVDARVREHFARMDTNRDGLVTKDEAMSGFAVRRMVAKGQAGAHDSRIVHIERRVAGGPGGHGPAVQFRKQIDGARAGDPNAAFDRLDANRDGQISRDEFARARTIRIEKRIAQGKGAPGVRGHHGDRGPGMFAGAMIRMVDNDRDGRISLAEATSGSLQHFDSMDRNRDGRLTPDERRAGRVMIRQMHTQRRGG